MGCIGSQRRTIGSTGAAMDSAETVADIVAQRHSGSAKEEKAKFNARAHAKMTLRYNAKLEAAAYLSTTYAPHMKHEFMTLRLSNL
ncbi:hypothetical protein NDU88_004766 [Pleurodeles waltl]|uniref:Uncharacterized protein n=1 Tax=Pleurodeles waltl TaxID=8319 RepID=A0AAV7M821_PLEWA|nr:hypothetical protein NDU88_004766 [Pleurodeles waltl]